jgi:ankyrin repeat protein
MNQFGASTSVDVGSAPTTDRTTIEKVLALEPLDAKSRAISQLESAGMSFTGDGFVRAVSTGYRPLIDLFITGGIGVDTPSSEGHTALLTAILTKDWALVQHLQGLGANVNVADPHGLTPLMAAAMADNVQTVRSLLAAKADLQAVDEHSHSAVHYAVATKSVATLNALIDAGADLGRACCDENNLLTHALETRDWRIVEPILARHQGKLSWNEFTRGEFAKALTARDAAKTRLLLAKHSQQPTPAGSTTPVLAHAVLAGDLKMFQFLLDCGADPNTPLNSPVEKQFTDRVPKAYLKHYLATEEGMTVLMLAAGLGQAEYVKALLDRGAARGIGTKQYKMPALLFATRSDNISVAQMLIEGSPKPEQLRVEISISAQRASVIRYGATAFSTEVSTGMVGFATPPGEYVITDKRLSHRSTIYKVPMPYFMRLSGRDFGMHEGVVPGYPASHGCIRVPGGTVRKLFKELPIGTLVSIRP